MTIKTFNQGIEAWLESIQYKNKTSTIVKYTNLYHNQIKEYFKDYNIDHINNNLLVEYLKDLSTSGRKDISGGLSNSSIALILHILQSTIHYLANIHMINDFKINYRIKKNYEPIDVLTITEQNSLEEYLIKHLNPSTLGILLCLYTGLRLGEICALQWKDLDLDNQSLSINKTIQRLPDNHNQYKTSLYIHNPKSSSSNRLIPMPLFIIGILNKLKQDDSYYLISSTTKPMDPRTYQNHFQYYLKQANIRHVNFHVLRHTFATRCVESNIDIKTVSEILGHASINTTLNYYVYSSFEFKKQEIEKLIA